MSELRYSHGLRRGENAHVDQNDERERTRRESTYALKRTCGFTQTKSPVVLEPWKTALLNPSSGNIAAQLPDVRRFNGDELTVMMDPAATGGTVTIAPWDFQTIAGDSSDLLGFPGESITYLGHAPTKQWLRIVPSQYRFNAAVYGDYLTSGTSIASTGAGTPALTTFRGNLKLPGYIGTGATVFAGFFPLHILHNIKAGTFPTFHIHWSHIIAAPTGNVKWYIDYSYSKGYDAGTFPAATTLSTVSTAGAQYTHTITSDGDMPMATTPEPDGNLICRIYRDPADAADTFANTAFLIQVDLHFQLGQVGTFERNRTFTSAGF